MIDHKKIGNNHQVTPCTERAARFLNTFVHQPVTMDEKVYQSMCLELSAAGCFIVDRTEPCFQDQADECGCGQPECDGGRHTEVNVH